MSIKIVNAFNRIIYDSNGRKAFKFPINTALDNILNDLWTDIIKYMCLYPFALGNEQMGYHKMTLEEFNANKDTFYDYYKKNNGIHIFGKLPNDDEMVNYLAINNSHVISCGINSSLKIKYLPENTKMCILETIDNKSQNSICYEITNRKINFNFVCLLVPNI
jgi:hypothetical protein